MSSVRRCMPSARIVLFIVFLAYLAGCNSGGYPTYPPPADGTPPPAAVAPMISALAPARVAAGAAGFTLAVSGSGFVSGSVVQWNGSARATTIIDSTRLSAAIPATDIATSGVADITVLNPDGQTSAPAVFTVEAVPALTSLSPETAVAGGGSFTLTVNGSGYRSGSQIEWNGSAIAATTVVSAKQLTAVIPASDIVSPASVPVDVLDTDSGERSGTLSFSITPPPPTLSSLSPSTVTAGSGAFNLTVSGSGFASGATVAWAGSPLTTALVSATQLTAAVPASDVANSGTVTVDVAQNGVRSTNQLTFTITAAAPVISSLSPASVPAGSPATQLTVNGSGFVASSVVDWNGGPLTTSYVSATQVRATIPAASLMSATTASITVVNPAANGGTSNAATFTVTAVVSGKIVQLVSPDYQTGGVSNNRQYSFQSPPTLSQDGRYVAFVSLASDLVANDTNGYFDAFLRDTCVGSSAPGECAPSTTRLSIDADGTYNNMAYHLAVVSNSGRYAAVDEYGQFAADFIDDCIGASAGCTPSIAHASYLPGASSTSPVQVCCSVLSPDGRYELFSTDVSNSAGTAQDLGIYVRDTCAGATGCRPGTTRVVTGTGTQPPHQPFLADIGTGGRYILFRTAGNDIIPSYSTTLHLFLEDTCLGVSTGCTVTYTPIDVRTDGSESEGNQANDAAATEPPSLSKDGRYVVFSSTDQQLVAGGTPHVSEVYLRDTCNGVAAGCIPSTTLVSADPTALSKDYRAYIGYRSVSEHGRYVAFVQEAVDSTTNSYVVSVRVRDTCIGAGSGCTPSISTASVDADGTFGTAHTSFFLPSISADGHYVAAQNSTDKQVYLSTTGY